MAECYRTSMPFGKIPCGSISPVFQGRYQVPTEKSSQEGFSYDTLNVDNDIARKIAIGELVVMSQHEHEKEIVVPRRRVIEEIIEKTVVVPQVIRREELAEERHKVKEKIIEVGEKPKIVEIPEIEYVEKIVEVPERKIKEIVKTVPVVQIKEEVKYVPNVILKEKIIETGDSDYEDGGIGEKYRHAAHIETIKGPQISVTEPRPMHCISYVRYGSCDVQTVSKQGKIPMYVPRFIEFPVYIDEIDEKTRKTAQEINDRVHLLASSGAPSLAELEKTAEYAKIFYQKLKTSTLERKHKSEGFDV